MGAISMHVDPCANEKGIISYFQAIFNGPVVVRKQRSELRDVVMPRSPDVRAPCYNVSPDSPFTPSNDFGRSILCLRYDANPDPGAQNVAGRRGGSGSCLSVALNFC